MAVKFANNNSLSAITSLPASITGGAWTLLSTATASSSSTVSITSGIDSTYKEYIIKFINIHGGTDNCELQFNLSADGGSNYNVSKTTTLFRAYQTEDDSATALGYMTGLDLANGTGVQNINNNQGADNDQSCSGYLYLFDPSSTTFVKHFIFDSTTSQYQDYLFSYYGAGYANTTSAVNAIQFQMNTGNIDSGVIKLYGVS